jgi:small-conductance mechanosensitive channel
MRAARLVWTILASAGVAGVVIGFAAQRSIATLLAGLQIALTQPIHIEDVVIVESEWGRSEEISLTYVVVSLWDLSASAMGCLGPDKAASLQP